MQTKQELAAQSIKMRKILPHPLELSCMRLLQDKENLKTRIVYSSSPARLCLADAAPAGGAKDLGLVEGEHGGDALAVLDQLNKRT